MLLVLLVIVLAVVLALATGGRFVLLADEPLRSLPWLGDTIPVALPNLGQAVSPGDVLVAAGAGLTVYAGMRGVRRPGGPLGAGRSAAPGGSRSEAEAARDNASQ